MNINDVELVRSLLLSTGYVETDDIKEVFLTSFCLLRLYFTYNIIYLG